MELALIENLENAVKLLEQQLEQIPPTDIENKNDVLGRIQSLNYRLSQLYGE